MNSPRDGPRLHVLNGKLTVFGGYGGTRSIEEYDGLNWKILNTTLNNEHAHSSTVLVPCN